MGKSDKAAPDIGAPRRLFTLKPVEVRTLPDKDGGYLFEHRRSGYFCSVHGMTSGVLCTVVEDGGGLAICAHCMVEFMAGHVAMDLRGYTAPRATEEMRLEAEERKDVSPVGPAAKLPSQRDDAEPDAKPDAKPDAGDGGAD